MKNVLLDTSAFSAHRRGHRGVVELVSKAHTVALSVTVLAEILQGLRTGRGLEKHLADLERFRSSPRFRLLTLDEETADRYARLVDGLRRIGAAIPTNGCWIAASALQHGCELVTMDREFLVVPMLAVQCFSWETVAEPA